MCCTCTHEACDYAGRSHASYSSNMFMPTSYLRTKKPCLQWHSQLRAEQCKLGQTAENEEICNIQVQWQGCGRHNTYHTTKCPYPAAGLACALHIVAIPLKTTVVGRCTPHLCKIVITACVLNQKHAVQLTATMGQHQPDAHQSLTQHSSTPEPATPLGVPRPGGSPSQATCCTQ